MIDIEGVKVNYRTAGDASGAPVVFVHGSGGNGGQWEAQIRGLPAGWRGVALDLPGHGESGGDGYRTIPEYRDVVRGVLRGLGAGPAVLVGHSMGGAITQALALAEPALLRGIVLVGTGARLRVHPDILEIIRRDHADGARRIVAWNFCPAASAALQADGERDLLRCPAAVIEGDLRACDQFDVMEEVARIRLPALIVCGEQDTLTPPKYARYLHQHIVGSRLVLVPQAGHYVMLEQPDAVTRALADFLAGCS